MSTYTVPGQGTWHWLNAEPPEADDCDPAILDAAEAASTKLDEAVRLLNAGGDQIKRGLVLMAQARAAIPEIDTEHL